MNRITLIISVFFSISFSFSQEYHYVGARSGSMANASVALVDGWSFFHNPGALGAVDKPEFGVSYESRFLLKDLQSQSVAFVFPIKIGVLSVGALLSGLDVYRTTKIGTGYSLKLTDKLFAGVQLNYQDVRFAGNYGSKYTVSAECGIYFKMTERWKFGVSVFNLNRARISSALEERLPTVMRLGTTFEISPKVLFAVEIEKNSDFQARLKSAVEYKPIKNFFLRGGFTSKPIEFTFGFGYRFRKIQLDLGSAYHQLLGWSPNFSLTYKFD